MEKYIKALEAERLEELEAYLLATGLKDYHLTEKEQLSLDKFENLPTLEQNSKGDLEYSRFQIYLMFLLPKVQIKIN